MKNLPNKIYLSFGEMTEERFEKEDYKEFCEYHNNLVAFHEQKFWETDVEYIRKDAFIEKAYEYFAPYIKDNSGGYDRAFVFEDFKKYMEE